MSMYIPPEHQSETGAEGGEFVDVANTDNGDDEVERRAASVQDARRAEPADDEGTGSESAPLDTHPEPGQLPSDTDVQAERQP